MKSIKEIVWSDSFSVGVEEIDEQHKYFISLVNDLRDSVRKKEINRKLTGDILSRLVAYANHHFETEEKYFTLFEYKYAGEHIAEHRKMIKKIEEMIEEHRRGNELIYTALLRFLYSWLNGHMTKYDRKYIECFKDHGLC